MSGSPVQNTLEGSKGMEKPGKAALVYTWSITGIGFVFLLALLPGLFRAPLLDLAFFLCLMLLAETLPVALPRGDGTVSVSFALSYAGMILYGPAIAAWLTALGTIRLHDLQGRVPLPAVLFNRAMLGLVAGLSAYVYLLMGAQPGMPRFPGDIAALAVCAIAYTLINLGLTAPFLALQRGSSTWGVFIANLRWLVPNLVSLAPIGLLLAILYVSHGVFSVAFFFGPLLVARYSFQRYIAVRDTYLETIKALVLALETKDHYTKGHSERVSQYSLAIGKEMGLGEDQLELLQYVGILHDMGKIGIRDAVLKKPGIFTAGEYGEMQRHPAIGGEIIKEIKMLGQSASWVRYHHERFDGTGFPEGLKGESIPLGARIISVADAYDAITSDRPYKKALSRQEAKEEILCSSGSQFDPAVVEAFIRILDKQAHASTGPSRGAVDTPC
jgi:hypothetical protein